MSENYEDLKFRWMELSASINKDISDKWWQDELVKRYGKDGGRAYHNFHHIANMFIHFDDCKELLKSPQTVAYAIFFHDIVYDPKSSEINEEKSNDFFKDYAKEAGIHEGSDLYEEVTRLISLTTTHLTEEHKQNGVYGDGDEHYFLDFDMAILGSQISDYDEYAEKIKEEYSFLPEKTYNDLRSKVLKSFLQIPKIFATEKFHKAFEEQARSNIQREIERLNSEAK
ncbi:hypothetical protein CHUAL_001157 [Chamberlinius hualienensis]